MRYDARCPVGAVGVPCGRGGLRLGGSLGLGLLVALRRRADDVDLRALALAAGAGLGAAGQFAKLSVPFETLRLLYPEGGVWLGFLVTALSALGLLLGLGLEHDLDLHASLRPDLEPVCVWPCCQTER